MLILSYPQIQHDKLGWRIVTGIIGMERLIASK